MSRPVHEVFMPGDPVASARVGQVGRRRFTQPKTRAWMDAVRIFGKRNMPEGGAISGPIRVDLAFFMPMPDGWSGAKRKRMAHQPVPVKPDKDNLEKAILDALSRPKDNSWSGWWLVGDQQVTMGFTGKWYAASDAEAGVLIRVSEPEAWSGRIPGLSPDPRTCAALP